MKRLLFPLVTATILTLAAAVPMACTSDSSLNPVGGNDGDGACQDPALAAACSVDSGSAVVDSGSPTDSGHDSGSPAEDSGFADTGSSLDAADSAPVDAGTDGAVTDAEPDSGAADADAGADDASVAPPLGACIGLLSDCSFETPAVSAGGTQQFSNGQTIGAWTVVGATGNVNTISTTFTQEVFTFEAEDGQQSFDLTGTSNTATGIAQTVSTTAGSTYQLAFWIGNVYDPAGIFGTTSTIQVQINGAAVYAPTNSGGSGTSTLDWEEFSYVFTATSASTTIGLINADPSNDTSNFVDNVSLVALTP